MVMRQQLLFALQRPDGLLGRLLPGTSNGSQIEVTADPGAFWSPGTTIYVVDAGNLAPGDGLMLANARVLREATKRDLAAAGVYLSGTHRVSGDAFPLSYEHRRMVYALGNAKIIAKGMSTTVRAWENAEIIIDSGTVIAHQKTKVAASGVARVYALDDSMVDAKDNVTVQASGRSTIRARGRAVVRADSPSPTTYLSEFAVRIDYCGHKGKLPAAVVASRLSSPRRPLLSAPL